MKRKRGKNDLKDNLLSPLGGREGGPFLRAASVCSWDVGARLGWAVPVIVGQNRVFIETKQPQELEGACVSLCVCVCGMP